MFIETRPRLLPIGFALAMTLGCGSPADTAGGEDLGQIGILLKSVPSDGTCVRFTTTAGTRSFQQTFDAAPDQALTAALHGLPYNQSLSIFAEAFAGSCSALTPTSLATYLSDAVVTMLAPGETKSLAFTLRPTGNVNGTADFLFLTVAPVSRAFGNVVIGRESPSVSFSIANIGMVSTSPLAAAIVDPPFFLTADTQFTISSNTCTGPLPAGQTCTVQVKLTPTTAGSKTASLQVSGMTGGTVSASLTGVGWTPAHLTISPMMANFGNVPIGGFSGFASFVITNTGDEPTGALTATVDPSTPDFFVASNSCTGTLAGHSNCQMLVYLAPTTAGPKSANVNVTSSAGGAVSAPLSGNGISPLTISPATAALGSAAVGTGGPTQVFTIRNTSAQPSTALTISSTSADFRVISDGCSAKPLQASATCGVTVQLFPTTTGPVSGQLNVDAAAGWSAQAALTGSGT
jgi:hypothetical protein